MGTFQSSGNPVPQTGGGERECQFMWLYVVYIAARAAAADCFGAWHGLYIGERASILHRTYNTDKWKPELDIPQEPPDKQSLMQLL
jgi:hypothetical protein